MAKQEKDNHVRKKIPIAFIMDHFYRGGGSENQLFTLVDCIDKNRFTPYVLNLRPKWKPIETNCKVFYLDVNSILSFRVIKAILEVARFLRRNRVEILQVYFFDSRIIGTLAGRLAGVKRIVFCRREMGWDHTRKKLLIFKMLAKLSHYCLVNAKAIKDMVKKAESFPENRIEVIYNGVELKPRSESAPKTKKDFNIPDKAPIVTSIANLRPVKRIDRLLRVADILGKSGPHFLVIGRGPLLDELKAQSESLGLTDRVHFYHTVGGISNILKISDIGILTSESEGLSNVLIEYALAGIPSVAFDIGGNREIIIDGQTGYTIPDGDEKKMAEKINYLLSNPEVSCRFGETARRLAREKFDVKEMVRKMEDFYLRIAGE